MMKSGIGRAALTGGGIALALVLLAATGLLVWRGVQESEKPVTRMLVIASAPGGEGGEVAALAFVLDSVTGEVKMLDTLQEASVAGSSAKNARDAFTFGGGAASAGALSQQTGGAALEWVVLPDDLWAGMLDSSGGVTVTVPEGFSAYESGRLTVLEPGEQRLSGPEAVALTSSVGYFEDGAVAAALYKTIGEELARVVLKSPATLGDSVTSGAAESSIEGERVFGGNTP